MEKDEFDYFLKKPIQYAFQGQSVSASFIRLSAPTAKDLKHTTILKSAIFEAIKNMEGKNTEESNNDSQVSEQDIDGEGIIAFLYMGGVDMSKVIVAAVELFRRKGLALIEGETNLTMPLIEKISHDDIEAMTGEYIANFIAPSAMGGRQKE